MSRAWSSYEAYGIVTTVGELRDVMAALSDDATLTLIVSDEECQTAAAAEIVANASGEPRYQSLLLEASIERALAPADPSCPAEEASGHLEGLADRMAAALLDALCGAGCGRCGM